MNEQTAKIKRFLDDPGMANAIKSVLMDSFTRKGESSDVYTLAAQRIAIDLLNDGWKELMKLKVNEELEIKTKKPNHV